MIVRNGSQVIGGITYRTFPGTPAARLGEIAFCAVAQTLQVTGCGTRLMNWTKVGAVCGGIAGSRERTQLEGPSSHSTHQALESCSR